MVLRSKTKHENELPPIATPGAIPNNQVEEHPMNEFAEQTQVDPVQDKRKNLIKDLLENQKQLTDHHTLGQHVTKNDDHLFVDAKKRIIIHDDGSLLLNTLICEAHGSDSGHHYGVAATYTELTRRFHWKSARQRVQKFVAECPTCTRVRIPKTIRTQVGDNAKWITSLEDMGPGSIVGVDVCEMRSEYEQTGFLTATCATTKWIRAKTVTGQTSLELIEGLSKMFLETFFPRVLVTDGAPSFKSKVFEAFCLQHKMIHLISPPAASSYHGWYERSHKLLLDQLRLLVIDHPNMGWTELLRLAQYLCNSRPYDNEDSSGLCPLHLVHSGTTGHNLTIDELPESEVLNTIRRIGIDHMLPDLPDHYRRMGERLLQRQKTLIRKYDGIFRAKREEVKKKLKTILKDKPQPEFAPGTYVRVYRPKASKVSPTFSEPRKIISAPSKATRIVENKDGKHVLEYIANLVPYES